MPESGHKHGYKPDRDKKKFKDCNAAAKHLNTSKHVAKTTPHVESVDSVSKPIEGDDGWEVSATRRYKVVQKKSTQTLPDWSWPNMSKGDIAARDSFQDAVEAHEDGHIRVAEDFAGGHKNEYTGKGDTQKEAGKDLQDQLDADSDRFYTDLKARQEEYDRVTDHGKTQSKGPDSKFPGGKDVVLKCPDS